MQTEITRVVRKLRSSGMSETLRSLWKEIYLMNILQSDFVMDKLHKRYSIETADRDRFKIASTNDGDVQTHLPARIWIDSEDKFENIEFEPVPGPELFTYDGSYLFIPPGVGFTREKEVIRDTFASEIVWNRGRGKTWLPSLFFYHGIYRTHDFFRRENGFSESDFDVALPLIPYWKNYYHWTMECLPKLRWIEEEYSDTEQPPKVLVPDGLASWMKESLDLLEINNIHVCEKDIYSIEELVVPRSPEPSTKDCEWIRDQMRAKVESTVSSEKRIYVSRENANRRRISNRDEIMSVLDDFGFESYILENRSVEEQVKLFSQAEAVVGPHGAGLTNMIYSSDPLIIELFGERKKTSYYRLAKMLDISYENVGGRNSGVDIRPDPDDLRSILQGHLGCS